MTRPIRLRWARFRASVARRLLDRLFADRTALWLVRVGNQSLPQMEGKIVVVRIEHDFDGWPERLIFSWQPSGMSLYDMRHVNVKALHFDRNLKKWAFYDC